MRHYFKNIQTVIGAAIAVFGLAGLWVGKFDSTTAISIIGIGAVWIGVTGKDAKQK